MDKPSFTAGFTIKATPEAVYAAAANPRAWWSEDIVGRADTVGATFDYHYRDIHRCRIRVTEAVPGKRLVWHVLENDFNFIADKTEWVGTDIVFEMSRDGDQTRLAFTHVGLTSDDACFEACEQGWNNYINLSLRQLLATGRGSPNAGEPMTSNERALSA